MASRATQTDTGIDPQIAELLGLDFTADLDREDYISLLKERMMAGRMSSSKLSSEETEILTDEFKRVKRDTRKTFKVKKTKITSDSFKKKTPSLRAGSNQKALPGTGRGGALAIRKTKVNPGALVKPGGEEQEQNILEKILASVNSILGTLKKDQNRKKKIENQERRKGERSKRKSKEDKLESGIFKGLAKAAKKILKPVEGILSRILKFIGTILIGKILQRIVDWMSDPKNEGKLDAIGDFLKNTWPLLLAAYLLFGNSLGRFATKLIGNVLKFSVTLIKKLIPGLLKGIKRLGFKKSLAIGGLAVGGGMLLGRMLDGGEDDKQPAPGKDGADGKDGKDAPPKEMSKGGTVPGSGNKDTVPAMLTPGEYVMSKGAVQKYGKGTMESMNAMGGGSGIPSFSNGMMYASSGGGVPEKNEPGGRNKTKSDDEGGGHVPGSDEDKQRPQKSFLEMMGFGSSSGKKDDKKNSESSSSGGGGFNESSLKKAMDKAGYTNPTERAMFLAQMAHESGNFRYDEEIHDGSNYEGRSDLGNTKAGDGKRYKGRGYIQLTGRANYTHYGNKLGVDLAGNPELAKKPDVAADVAVAYWNERVDRAAAASGDVRTVTKNINGGYNGLQDRIDKFKKYSGNPNYTAPGGGPIASSSGGGSSSVSSSSGGGSGGGGFGGLLTLAKMQKISRGSSSSTSSSSSSTSSASLGSKPSPSAPPAPPTKAAPKVSVVNSGGASSGQQTPISETGSYVPSVPSSPTSPEKKAVLGIS
jgi:predicted chitinase